MDSEDYAAVVGIDWADQRHAICLIAPGNGGLLLDEGNLDHEPDAIDQWVAGLRGRFPGQKVAVCLEQKRGSLIYALMKYDNLILFPINPAQLASFRDALSPSGAKDDPTDARWLAELLTKHPDRLRQWRPDDEQTREIRLLAEDRRNLVNERTRLTNRLKNTLKSYFPVALKVTGRIHGNLACQLLSRYPTLEKLQSASDEELQFFFHDHYCYHPSLNEERIKTIRGAMPLTTDQAIIDSAVLKVRATVAQILAINDALETYDARLRELMKDHPDAEIFQALPGAGAAMAPRLLAALGADRARVASPEQVQQMAGIAPVTKESGKSRVVQQRWACNKFLRQTFHEFAAHSTKHSDWAKAYYDMLRARGKKHQAAIRALAFKWIRIIVRCWKDRIRYDELTHLTSLMKTNSPVLAYLARENNS